MPARQKNEFCAADIDHKRTLMEDIAVGDPNYPAGWFTARDEAETLVHRLVSTSGKEAAQIKLAAAITKKR